MIIGVFHEEDRLVVERAIRYAAKSVVASDEKGVRGLKHALGEAVGKFNPDRTVLPVPDRTVRRLRRVTLDESVGRLVVHRGPKAPRTLPTCLSC